MTITKDLFLAILSMDSYNRGYGAGIGSNLVGLGVASDGSVKIGSASVTHNLSDANISDEAQAAGFYAISYTLDKAVGDLATNTTVISYRGTDRYFV